MAILWDRLNDASNYRVYHEHVIPAGGSANMVFHFPESFEGKTYAYQMLTEVLQVIDGFYKVEFGPVVHSAEDGIQKTIMPTNRLFDKPAPFEVFVNDTITLLPIPDWAFVYYLGNTIDKNNKYSADDAQISVPTIFKGHADIVIRYTNLDNKEGTIIHSMYVATTDIYKANQNAVG